MAKMRETYSQRWMREQREKNARDANAFPPPCPECGATFGCRQGNPDCSLAIPDEIA